MPDFKKHAFKIHYVEEGRGDPIVFLHGLTMDHTMYAAQFEELPKTYRCIAVDLRGHGRSELPKPPWTVDDFVEDAVSFIRGVEAAPCHLVGMSLGGMIALRVALDHAELLRSLVLIDTSADAFFPEANQMLSAFAESIEDEGLTDGLVDAMINVTFGTRYQQASPEAMTAYRSRLHDMDDRAISASWRSILGRPSLADRLGAISVPTLVIHGSEDVLPMDDAEQMTKGIPGAELVRIEGAGHTTPMEAPDEVNEALERFFAKVR